ncbi:hypothetical protein RN001_010973 [Aquatica leii]|uniref:Regulatory protein zeste n=1 Tax=Aquatica leii TaxID=1421715 RepID=A0AAN7PX35_9COLE|nr:hypothetical protein RN001_010973 [Aquatica leii]
MIKPQFDKTFTIDESNKLWEQLSTTLNRVEGAKKSIRGWRRCWRDLRRNTKEKVARLRQLGLTLTEDLTPIQEKVRALIEESDGVDSEPVVYFDVKQENIFKSEQTSSNSLKCDATKPNVVESLQKTMPITRQKPFRRKLRSFAERKLCMKKSYYDRKLSLLEQHIQAINRQTDAINKQTVVHERLMQLLNPK